jgi:Flp pilus assembly protein TadG
MIQRNPRQARRGVAAVELAIVSVFILVPCAYGMIELSRAIQVKEILTDAARSGARVASTVGKSNTDVTTAVNAALSANSIATNLATITVKVDGATANCNTAAAGAKVSVSVSVPANAVNYMTLFFMTSGAVQSQAVTMMRQG